VTTTPYDCDDLREADDFLRCLQPKNERLLLADTKISGNLQSLARMELVELDLSGTAISGDLQSLVGDFFRFLGLSPQILIDFFCSNQIEFR
jgi:hypothetical protein